MIRFQDIPAGFKPNTKGKLPDEARGKRVVVVLRNGKIAGAESVNGISPPGWAADGGPNKGCRWSHSHPDDPCAPFDIWGYKVL